MDRRTEVIDVLPVIRSKEEHARHWREAGAVQRNPWIDRHLNIEHGGVAGPDGEAIGCRSTLAVEQRVHNNGIGARRGFLDPEDLEEREFLALCFAGVDSEAPRRQAVQLSLGYRAKITCAEKNADLVVIVGLVDRRMQAKT